MSKKVSVFWFRRDLRLNDNVGLLAALKSEFPVLPIFIFDKEILAHLPKNDARVDFIHEQLQKMHTALQAHGGSLAMYFGTPETIFKQLLDEYDIQAVYTNRDYEPYARDRDVNITQLLASQKKGADNHPIPFYAYKDQVIFEENEIVKKDGNPYVCLLYTSDAADE